MLLSVVIPTSNRPMFLRCALESVRKQSVQPDEVIVIDNGDVGVDKTNLLGMGGLKIIRGLPRFGVAQARNLGACLSSGEWIAFLDDDDIWHPDYLKVIYSHILQSDTDILLGCLLDLESGEPLKTRYTEFFSTEELARNILTVNPAVQGSNTAIKRDLLFKTAGFNPRLKTGQDKALVLDCIGAGAKVERAIGAWVYYRDDSSCPRNTDSYNVLRGKIDFLFCYWELMKWKERAISMKTISKIYLRVKKRSISKVLRSRLPCRNKPI